MTFVDGPAIRAEIGISVSEYSENNGYVAIHGQLRPVLCNDANRLVLGYCEGLTTPQAVGATEFRFRST